MSVQDIEHIDIPEELWQLPIFAEPARFPDAVTGIGVETIELALRRIKNMPVSTADAEIRISKGLEAVLQMTKKWLAADGFEGQSVSDIITRIERMKSKLAMAPSPAMRESVLQSIRRFIPEKLHPLVPDGQNYAQWSLELLVLAYAEDYLKNSAPDLYKKYLRRVFCVIETSLEYNPTTDVRRIYPLLQWIRFQLAAERRSGYAFCDVGCALGADAPSLVHAATALKPQGLCRAVHGVDIVGPSKKLRNSLRREHGICVYASDFVSRPLPRKYDAILLANVHRLLDRDSQKRLLENLWRSLKPMGFLFINWRFAPELNPCLCLRRWQTGFYIDKQNNLP